MRFIWAVILALSLASTGFCAEKETKKAESSVRDYEEKIEEMSREIDAIRKDLETLTRDMVEGETGRVLFFLKGKPSDWNEKGVNLVVDGKTVLSRMLTDAELDVLGKDLPLEVFETRLAAGPHSVTLGNIGDTELKPSDLTVKRATINSWIAKTGGGLLTWDVQ